MTSKRVFDLPYFTLVRREESLNTPPKHTSLEDSLDDVIRSSVSHFDERYSHFGTELLSIVQVPPGITSKDVELVGYFMDPVASKIGNLLKSQEDSARQADDFLGISRDADELPDFAEDYFVYLATFMESAFDHLSDAVALDESILSLLRDQNIINTHVSPLIYESFATESLIEKGRHWSKKLLFGAFAKNSDLVAPNDIGQDDVYKWRADVLNSGNTLYVKPDLGACASRIMHLELVGEKLHVSAVDTSIHSYLLAASDEKLHDFAEKSVREKKSYPEKKDLIGGAAFVRIGSVVMCHPDLHTFDDACLMDSTYVDGELSVTRISPRRMTNYDVESDGKTTVVSNFNSLLEVISDISTYYDLVSSQHYAEREITSALTDNGNPVESRVIVQRENGNLTMTGMYFKARGGGHFNCISNGGAYGANTQSVLSGSGISEEQFKEGVMGVLPKCIGITYNLLNKQLKTHLPDFPFSDIRPSTVSFDFIYSGERGDLKPVPWIT